VRLDLAAMVMGTVCVTCHCLCYEIEIEIEIERGVDLGLYGRNRRHELYDLRRAFEKETYA
jgi:hypothetical protein